MHCFRFTITNTLIEHSSDKHAIKELSKFARIQINTIWVPCTIKSRMKNL